MENTKIQSQSISSSYALDQLSRIDDVCAGYGLHGRIINYKNDESVLGSGLYVVVGVEPIDDDVKPYKITNRIVRDPDLFYPNDFAVKLTPENPMVALDQIMEFCKDAEFLSRLYAEFHTELPECIRYSELSGLKNWCDGRYNEDMNDQFRSDCVKGLKRFFKHENSPSGQEKRKFFRSERFDVKLKGIEGKIQYQKDYANRNSSIIRRDVLINSSDETCKRTIEKSRHDSFIRYMQNSFPEVLFAIEKKEVVDTGLIEVAKDLPPGHPFLKQKPVTNEEFERVIKERFATEGFGCTNDLKPARWEFYDIYYKKVDEPQIIAAYNDLYLAFAEHDPLQDIKQRGPMSMIDMPVDDIHFFVALAKSKNLQFHFDHRGKFSVPSFTDIHIVYSTRDQAIMDEIVNEMVSNNILNSHIVSQQTINESLNSKISSAQRLESLMHGKQGYPERKSNERG